VSGAAPGLYTIPAGTPFVDALAAGLEDLSTGDPLRLARVTVLLPNRRAARSLREAFLRRSGGRPLLLPRMMPLGDVDPAELVLAAGLDLPPVMPELRRRLLLAQLVMRRKDLATLPGQAVALAGELGRLLDRVVTERADWAGLSALVPEDYAEHWQRTIAFLEIVSRVWPDVLAEEGAIDAADHRNRLLEGLAAHWRANPPDGWVVAAGSTGSAPATADLMDTVARLPRGMIVLPGLDRHLDEASWDAVAADEAHPQHGLCRLLARLGATRRDVRDWPAATGTAPEATRGRAVLLAEAMRPAATTDAWRERPAIHDGALAGLVRIDCPGPQDEATVIALLMRETLETPGKTCALVTPDRPLARRVAAALRRWGVDVDDSAGRPLRDTPVGAYLRLVADCALAQAAPVALLSLLKHPLASGGRPQPVFRSLVRALEMAVLRGPKPGPGFEGLRQALRSPDARFGREHGRDELLAFVDELDDRLGPLTALLTGPAQPPEVVLEAHMAAAEALADAEDTAGQEVAGPLRLWRHEDGEAAAVLVAEIAEAIRGFPAMEGPDYPPLFEALIAGAVVRPRYGLHPRLHVLGLLEARLQHFDRMILGGLNEGVWPADPAIDPWMSRPMRKAFGLPAPEREVGLAAHDFVQAASCAEVFLTRADRAGGAPTVPARWLTRLDTAIKAAGLDPDALRRDGRPWLARARALDRPAEVRAIAPPAPCPPVALRPRALSVTQIETWMRDPYAIHARWVLKLKPLEPLEADPGAAERGTFIHTALDAFVRAHPMGELPPDALDRLLAAGVEAFGPALGRPEVWSFWWPRFERVAQWFLERERERRLYAVTVATEVEGSLTVEGLAGPFTVRGKADRIDRLADGTLSVIDYKTGGVPGAADVRAGLSPQLPLEAAMAAAGGFAGVPAGPVGELAVWRLTGGDPPGEVKALREEAMDLAQAARTGLETLVRLFDDPATPYRAVPRPAHAPRFSDYAHLARVQEWATAADGGE